MKFETATIKDIAKALNLSAATISRALRGSNEISEETKKQVREYATKVNYRPNPVALSLKERRTRSIGVVVSEIANNFFSQAINGIESVAYKRGYYVIITQTHESREREGVNVAHMAARGVDGLLISLSSETDDISHLEGIHSKGLPIVFFDRIPDEIQTHKVVVNNFHGAFDATEHLIQQGFRQIAHITFSPFLSIARERIEGYKAALEKHGLPFNESLIKHCLHGGLITEEAELAMAQLAAGDPKPDAYFTASDRLTTVCYRFLKNQGNLHAGLIGFSNTQVGDLFAPTLSTITQPAMEMGQSATELLIQVIEGKRPMNEYQRKVMDTAMFTRESSQRRV